MASFGGGVLGGAVVCLFFKLFALLCCRCSPRFAVSDQNWPARSMGGFCSPCARRIDAIFSVDFARNAVSEFAFAFVFPFRFA